MIYLGGLQVVSFRWQSAAALEIRFETNHTNLFHQIYAGRRLLSETTHVGQREFVVQYQFARWPEHFRIIAIDDSEVGIDHGSKFPPRPYNVARLNFSTAGWPNDSELIEIRSSIAPDQAVDANNVIESILYDGPQEYALITEPLAGSGLWSFEINGRDNRPPNGNLGTPIETNVEILAHPPDFDSPWKCHLTEGLATIDVTIPAD